MCVYLPRALIIQSGLAGLLCSRGILPAMCWGARNTSMCSHSSLHLGTRPMHTAMAHRGRGVQKCSAEVQCRGVQRCVEARMGMRPSKSSIRQHPSRHVSIEAQMNSSCDLIHLIFENDRFKHAHTHQHVQCSRREAN